MKKLQTGIGILEALIAMVVMGIMVSAIWYMNGTNSNTMSHLQYRNNAMEVGRYVMDSLALQGPYHASLAISGTSDTASSVKTGILYRANGTRDSVPYNIRYKVTKQDKDVQGFAISKKIDLTVSWTMGNKSSSITLNGVVK